MAEQIEATVDALVQKLLDGLPAAIDAINADNADEHFLAYPEGVSHGPRSEVPYPWITVTPEGTESPVDSGGRIHFRHRIRFSCWIQDWNEEALTRKLERMAAAVRKVALARRLPGTSHDQAAGYGLLYSGDEYGPFLGEELGENFTSWVAVDVIALQQQDV